MDHFRARGEHHDDFELPVLSQELSPHTQGNVATNSAYSNATRLSICRLKLFALIAVGLVFNAGGVKDVLLELFNKIIGA